MAQKTSVIAQSPIDLGSAVESTPVDMTIRFHKSVMHGHDRDTTLMFSVAGGSSVTYEGHRYELKEFHFHTPSEHVIDGEYFPAEVHFVAEDAAGDTAVVAVFVEESTAVRAPSRLDQAMPMKGLLPDSDTHYSYLGSLTTPPYDEGVQWIVLAERVALHPDWLDAFRDRYGANNRDLQPIGDRTVVLG